MDIIPMNLSALFHILAIAVCDNAVFYFIGCSIYRYNEMDIIPMNLSALFQISAIAVCDNAVFYFIRLQHLSV